MVVLNHPSENEVVEFFDNCGIDQEETEGSIFVARLDPAYSPQDCLYNFVIVVLYHTQQKRCLKMKHAIQGCLKAVFVTWKRNWNSASDNCSSEFGPGAQPNLLQHFCETISRYTLNRYKRNQAAMANEKFVQVWLYTSFCDNYSGLFITLNAVVHITMRNERTK